MVMGQQDGARPRVQVSSSDTTSRSVCGKSLPTHSSGSAATSAVAYVRQSPKFSAAG